MSKLTLDTYDYEVVINNKNKVTIIVDWRYEIYTRCFNGWSKN